MGVGADVDQLFDLVGQLRELAADPGSGPDSGPVYDFSIRWGALLAGRLQRLAYYHGQGVLSPDDRARYAALCAQLREMSPTIERLRLAHPKVPLVDPGPG